MKTDDDKEEDNDDDPIKTEDDEDDVHIQKLQKLLIKKSSKLLNLLVVLDKCVL